MTIMQSAATTSKQSGRKRNRAKGYLWIAFFVPMLLMVIGFVLQRVHPFGEQQILVMDFWHQYYPFLRLLHEKLQSGGSLLYTWESGMGSNFLSMMAYYAASPLNLLTALVPEHFLREAVTVILLLKIGFAGLFFACFLKRTFHRNDFSLCIFSVMYALCSYMLGYYWNIIWLDTVALLPLVILGLLQLVRDGKYRLYVIALGLSLLTNYYIGMFTCIFAVIAYLCLCIFYLRSRQLLGRSLAMLGGSLLGGALAAVLLVPAYYALQLTYNVQNTFPTTLEFYESWRTLAANLISYHAPTAKEGLPNLASGVLSLVLIGPFLRSGKIHIREKVCAVLVLAFLLISCNCNVLNYIWHGFHFPNMLPFRFSFLFSFAILTVAYRAFLLILDQTCKILDILAMLLMSVVVFVISYGVQENQAVYWTFATMILYILILLLGFRRIFGKNLMYAALSVVLLFEMFENTRIGTETVSTSDYASYPSMSEEVSSLLEQIEQQDDTLFYRTEMSSNYTLNDPALYGYRGLSQFSSTVNVNVTRWMHALGLPSSEAGNRYYYGGSTPATNMFSGIQYLICRSGAAKDSIQWENIAKSNASYAYRNRYALPVGFWTTSDLASYRVVTSANPFDNQNDLFSLATGIETPLFTAVDVEEVTYTGASATRNGYGNYSYSVDMSVDEHLLKYSYSVGTDAVLYGYVQAYANFNLIIHRNDVYVTSYSISDQPYIFSIGQYLGNETASLTIDLNDEAVSGVATLYVYQMNLDVLQEGYEKLSQGGITLTECTDTTFVGEMQAQEDGLCYFSIPYEEGWHAQVDGTHVEIQSIGDAMIAVPVTKGMHTIRLTYCPKGFVVGACMTIGGILLLLILYAVERKRGKPLLSPVLPAEKAAETELSEQAQTSLASTEEETLSEEAPDE